MALESILHDLNYAARLLRRSPGFAAAAIVTLALGIGANTAIFSVVYAVLLERLPYADPDRICAVDIWTPQFLSRTPSMGVRARDFLEWRRSNTSFSQIAAFRGTALNLTGAGDPERLGALRGSWNLLAVLGVAPARGRNFLPEEDQPERNSVVILSHEFWTSRFGADPAIFDRTIQLDGRAYRVAGILPANFVFPTGKQYHPLVPLPPRIDVWVPLAITPAEIAQTGSFDYGVIGRVRPGLSIAEAHQRMDATAYGFGRRDKGTAGVDLYTHVVPIREVFAGNVRSGVILLAGAAALLLLIACVNLANLFTARMTSRAREFATRAALGARQSRLARQVLTETALVSLLGGAAAVVLAQMATRWIVSLGPADLPMRARIGTQMPVLWFTLAVALLTSVVFGLVPALEARRRDPHENLKAGGRGSTAARTGRLRYALVTAEVALSTILLAAAGLLLHSFVKVIGVDRGFAVERILSVDLALAQSSYSAPGARVAFFRELAQRLRALPGVAATGAVTDLPLSNEARTSLIHLESDTQPVLDRPVAAARNVTPGYFAALEIPLLAGRFFRDDEPVAAAVISRSLAQGLWPGAAPDAAIGRGIRQSSPRGPLIRVVGVVGDVQTASLDQKPMPQIYRPYSQGPATQMSLVIRASGDAAALGRAVRAEIRSLDGAMPVEDVRAMREIVSDSVAVRRFQMALIAAFALLALALTLVGIYGVVRYTVARRTGEIGLRMALGARQGDVLRMVLAQGLAPVAAGLGCGIAGAAIEARVLRGFLFGIAPLDPVALGGVAGVLLVTAALACYLPARRAAAVDPMLALREE